MKRKNAINRILLLFVIITALFACHGCTFESPDEGITTERGDGNVVIDLEANEERGGHVIEKHVGKSDDELIQRLKEDTGISAASTFTDMATAEMVISQAILENGEDIDKWLLETSKDRYVLYYEGEEVIGRGISREDDAVQDLKDAKIVLARVADTDYFVLTAYPTF